MRRATLGGLIALPALAVLMWVTPVRAQDRGRDLTLESMTQGVRLGEPSFSPDGRTILLASNRSGHPALWMVDRDGGNARAILDDQAGESDPVWSPDGSKIAFLRRQNGHTDIWVVARDGTGARQVTDDADFERALVWSPDGTRILYVRGQQWDVGDNRGQSGYQDLYVVDVASGQIEQLTKQTNPWDEYRFEPAWSPDGKWVAYESNRSGTWLNDLWLVDPSSKQTIKVSSRVWVMSTPVWSPDGEHIAFNGVDRHDFWYGDMSDIYVVDMPSRHVRKLDMNTWVSDRNGGIHLGWSPDSRSLFFRYEWEGNDELWRVSADGGVATKLTYGEGTFGNFAVSPDGRAITYVRSTPLRRGELYRYDLEGGSEVRLTAWTKPYRDIAAPRRITFPSYDGKYILGYLYLPPGFDPKKTYPSAVQVHGGGNNAYANGFHALEHLVSHNGYVVVAIEYRGSAGHGRAFQDLSLAAWAAEQGWDAVYAARYLRAQPWSNGKVGIYGGSYGGIMTGAAVTRDSKVFDAAAPLYGIYDWGKAFEGGDYLMQFWIIQGHLGFKPGENPDLYHHTASIEHLDGVRRDLPFLIMAGELDRRAPFTQSKLLVQRLQERGNPVEFHWYPNEQHGFRLPADQIDAYGRLLRFFGRYLKGGGS